MHSSMQRPHLHTKLVIPQPASQPASCNSSCAAHTPTHAHTHSKGTGCSSTLCSILFALTSMRAAESTQKEGMLLCSPISCSKQASVCVGGEILRE